jgi:hypothetical protein
LTSLIASFIPAKIGGPAFFRLPDFGSSAPKRSGVVVRTVPPRAGGAGCSLASVFSSPAATNSVFASSTRFERPKISEP